MSNIPVFVINLPRDVERRKFVEQQLGGAHLSYEIVDGVYGTDERITKTYDEALALKEQGKPLTNGEKGCAFTHRLIYERMIRESIPYALVLEDDVILPTNFKSIVEKEGSKEPKKWDWLALDYQSVGVLFIYNWIKASYKTIKAKPVLLPYIVLKAPVVILLQAYEGIREYFAKKTGLFVGPRVFLRPMYRTGAYMITLEGAKKMIPLTTPLRLSADRAPNQARVRNGLVYRGYVPVPVDQEQSFNSNTQQ